MPAIPTLIGLPYDASSSFLSGAAQAPALIRAALHSPSANTWTESLQNIADAHVLGDIGDLELTSPEQSRAAITEAIAQMLDAGQRPLSLGGDHSVTYPILRAIAKKHPSLTILHIDAHPDLYDSFEGDRYSHACPFARIMEEKYAQRLVQVGIRAMSLTLQQQAQKFGVDVIDMRAWEKGKRPQIIGPVYMTIDLDGIDPAFAPGVSHFEPGGLSVREVISMIQQLSGPIVGADIVEYNPVRDLNGVTAMVAAKLVKELAARMVETKN